MCKFITETKYMGGKTMRRKKMAMMMTAAMIAGVASVNVCAKDDGWVIGYICKDLSQEWFQKTLTSLEDVAESMGASDVIALDCEMDPEKCLNNLDNLIAQDVDLVIICTPDQELSQTIVNRCDTAEILVFADAMD